MNPELDRSPPTRPLRLRRKPDRPGQRRGSLALLTLVCAVACGGRCPGGRTRGAHTPTDDSVLATLPPDTEIVLGLDFARLRAGGTWPALRAALGDAGRPEDRAQVQAFAARTGFDPFTQADRVTVAFPENAQARGAFGIVLGGHDLDESRLVAYIRDRLRERGDDLSSRLHAGRTLWSNKESPALSGAFVGRDEVIFGAGGFPERILDLRAGSSLTNATGAPAATSASSPQASATRTFDRDLAALLRALGPSAELWGAAAVPATTRAHLAEEPRFKAAASVQRLGFAANLDPGLEATVLADLGSVEDAAALTAEARQALARAKSDPKTLLLGLTSFLDGLSVEQEGTRFALHAKLSPERTRDLLGRVAAWTALAAPAGPRPPGFPTR